MHKSMILGIVGAALVAGVPAMAADMAADMAAKTATMPTAVSASDWTGFYLGGNVGGVWTRSDGTFNPLPTPTAFGANRITNSLDSSSVAIGLHGGFNWQCAPSFMVGIEGDFTWTNAHKAVSQSWTYSSTTTPIGGSNTTISAKLESLSSIRVRLGYLVTPQLLAYVTGGRAWGRVHRAASDTNGTNYATAVDFSRTLEGYAAGGGLEWRFASHWTLRGEYLFYRLDGASSVGTSAAYPGYPSGYEWSHMNIHEGRVGVSCQF